MGDIKKRTDRNGGGKESSDCSFKQQNVLFYLVHTYS